MGKLVKAIFGGGAKKQVDTAPKEDLEATAASTKGKRATLFKTEGGIAGEELDPSSVQKRNTLLGN